jgi:hypothetical protein
MEPGESVVIKEEPEEPGEPGEPTVIEEDTEDMIVLKQWWTSHGNGIRTTRVMYPKHHAVFECKPNTGRIQRLHYHYDDDDLKNLSLKPGEEFRWMDGNNYPRDESYTDHDFIEIVLKLNPYIIGYAVIDVLERNYDFLWDALVLKSVLFPQVGGEFQNVSEEYVKTAIEKVKSEHPVEKGAGEDMVKPLACSWVSDPGIPPETTIEFEYSDSNAVFECSVDKGQFGSAPDSPKSLFVKPGDVVYWQPDPGGETKGAYVKIILRINDNITGYALIIIAQYSDSPRYLEYLPGYIPGYIPRYSAKTMRTAFFPQIGGEYQTVSEEYVHAVFEEVKSMWRKEVLQHEAE